MSKTRAIRFSDAEEKLIQEFLQNNPFFDFSTLARTSILTFIENPQLKINPVNIQSNKKKGAALKGELDGR